MDLKNLSEEKVPFEMKSIENIKSCYNGGTSRNVFDIHLGNGIMSHSQSENLKLFFNHSLISQERKLNQNYLLQTSKAMSLVVLLPFLSSLQTFHKMQPE